MDDFFIGLISGTSIDSVDAALVRFSEGSSAPQVVARCAQPIPESLRSELAALTTPTQNELDRMAQLDSTVARLFARSVSLILSEAGIGADRIRAIGSHGQTVRHAPKSSEPYSLQIGNPSLIAELTGIDTVADFRRRDMAAGGQGAPLAPAFHNAFFRHPGEDRTVVNIGGIANITVLPANAGASVTGFDTGPGNTLLDIWAQRHLGSSMDDQGRWGKAGRPLQALLKDCLQDSYFSLPPPKSTGREYFNLDWLEARVNAAASSGTPQNVQATLIELTVQSIASAIRQHAGQTRRLLVCGGGIHNPGIMEGLARQLAGVPVESTERHGVDPDYLEAVGFAWLAKRHLDRCPGNLPDVTGARGPRILGGLFPA